MNTSLRTAASDLRTRVVQPETNADRPLPLSSVKTPAQLLSRLKVTPPGKVLRLLATAPLSPRCKVLVQVLWCRAVWRSGDVHPSTSEGNLLADTAMSRTTLYRALDDLTKAGLLMREKARRNRFTRYVLPWAAEYAASVNAEGKELVSHALATEPIGVSRNPELASHLTRAKGVEPLSLPSQPSEATPSTPPPTALPPTTEPRRTAAGGASRLRSKADGERQPLTEPQRHVKAFLAIDCGMWSGPADDLARSGTTLEAAQIAWEEVQASDRTNKGRALEVRLTENAEGYERQSKQKREEARIEAERQRRKPELDRNSENCGLAWNAFREADRTAYNLLAGTGTWSLKKASGCEDWFKRVICGGPTPLDRPTRGPRQRHRALVKALQEGTVPVGAMEKFAQAFRYAASTSPLLEAVQEWQQAVALPQAAG